MQVQATEIPGVLLLMPRYFNDARGCITLETYNARAARDAGLHGRIRTGQPSPVAAARHCARAALQAPPKVQAKLVRVLRGSVYDVAVDLRAGSPNYDREITP